MRNKVAHLVFAAWVASSGVAQAEDHEKPAAPQALTDAELDAITAAGVTVIVSNPGNAKVFNVRHDNVICVSCGGPSDATSGLIITPKGKIIIIPGGPL